MTTYYKGRNARRYNTLWRSYTDTTLERVLNLIDFTLLLDIPKQQGRAPRILDIACGTGILLSRLLKRIPTLEAYGVDGSRDMLAQARQTLVDYPNVHLEQTQVNANPRANLRYEPSFFDLITMTNALHDMAFPQKVLYELSTLLSTDGQLVVEDYARRSAPFPWKPFEWGIKRIEPEYVKAYNLSEAQLLFDGAALHVQRKEAFEVDVVCHAWVIQARK